MYSGWQKQRVRSRLNAYRYRERTGKKPLPIQGVLERMVEVLHTQEGIATEEEIREIDNDTMRRFCAGTQELRAERLTLVKKFLIFEGVLDEFELKDDSGDWGELFALHSYLANESPVAMEIIQNLSDSYGTVVDYLGVGEMQVRWSLEKDGKGTFFRVTESFEQVGCSMKTPESKHHDLVEKKFSRRGYGFLSTKANLLHIFFRGASRLDRVHYIEAPRGEYSINPRLFRAGGEALRADLGTPIDALFVFKPSSSTDRNADSEV